MKINGCLGCWHGGKDTDCPCVQKDDMAKIYPVYREADVVVLASPLYYWFMLHGITHRHPSCLKISEEQGWPVAYSKEEFGYFIHVDEEQSWEDDDSELPEDLKAILRYAFSLGCAWINLDRDGEVVNGVLPVYEW